MTTTARVPHPTYTDSSPASGRIRLTAVALAASAATMATLVATHPWGERLDSSADEVLSYDALLPHRDGAWSGILADSLAVGVLAFCLALAACHLAPTRGRVAATVGSALVVIGGLLSAMGGLAFAQVVWFATGAPEASGRELVSYANDEVGHLLGVQMAGFATFTLATLVLAGALVRARMVPLPAALAFVALTVGLFLPIPGRAIDAVQCAQLLLVAGLAVPLWRRA